MLVVLRRYYVQNHDFSKKERFIKLVLNQIIRFFKIYTNDLVYTILLDMYKVEKFYQV